MRDGGVVLVLVLHSLVRLLRLVPFGHLCWRIRFVAKSCSPNGDSAIWREGELLTCFTIPFISHAPVLWFLRVPFVHLFLLCGLGAISNASESLLICDGDGDDDGFCPIFTHNPVLLSLLVPFGHLLSNIDGARDSLRISAGIPSLPIGSHRPVCLFRLVPFGHRFARALDLGLALYWVDILERVSSPKIDDSATLSSLSGTCISMPIASDVLSVFLFIEAGLIGADSTLTRGVLSF